MFIDFVCCFLYVDVNFVMCVGVLKLVDDSLFVNEIFSFEFIDVVYV